MNLSGLIIAKISSFFYIPSPRQGFVKFPADDYNIVITTVMIFMEKVCVVDFDKTLLTVDSTKYMIFKERLYLRLPVLFWGMVFLFASILLPRGAQIPIRRRAKYQVLKAISSLGETPVLEKYSKIFSGLLNRELLKDIRRNYKGIYVITSAWQPLVRATLEKAGVMDFEIFGTEFTINFKNFKTCWHEEKAKLARRLGLSQFDLYTDSKDDEPLMKLASKVVMVR